MQLGIQYIRSRRKGGFFRASARGFSKVTSAWLASRPLHTHTHTLRNEAFDTCIDYLPHYSPSDRGDDARRR